MPEVVLPSQLHPPPARFQLRHPAAGPFHLQGIGPIFAAGEDRTASSDLSGGCLLNVAASLVPRRSHVGLVRLPFATDGLPAGL